MASDDAMAVRDETYSDADHVKLLQEQLADHDKQLTETLAAKLKAESDLALAKSDLAEANKTIQHLKTHIEGYAAPAPMQPTNSGIVPPNVPADVVSANKATEA